MLKSAVWGPKNRDKSVDYSSGTVAQSKDMFKLVKASKLSLSDDFMNYSPKYYNEEKIYNRLYELIEKSALEDFYAPIIDPTKDENGNICYQYGKKPCNNKSYEWWGTQADNFYPEKNSRLGRDDDFVAFLGTLVQFLVYSDWEVKDAWRAICYDSSVIVNYTFGAKTTGFEAAFCGYYDLVASYKILARHPNEPNVIILGSGSISTTPIGDIGNIYINPKKNIAGATGWLIYSA